MRWCEWMDLSKTWDLNHDLSCGTGQIFDLPAAIEDQFPPSTSCTNIPPTSLLPNYHHLPLTMPPTCSSTCTEAMLVQPVNNGTSSQQKKTKHHSKAEIAEDVQHVMEEKVAAQEAQLTINQWLANLEAVFSCDTDLPMPHPLSLS